MIQVLPLQPNLHFTPLTTNALREPGSILQRRWSALVVLPDIRKFGDERRIILKLLIGGREDIHLFLERRREEGTAERAEKALGVGHALMVRIWDGGQ